ncbi:MAG: hypothetical protein KAI24_16285, partial [Planctomycetes bacterium]|nr:hypothetical protein [Planctomycetota bacterium]
PGPAAVRAVEEAIRAGGDALREAALAALDEPDDRRRLRAHLALQTLGASDDELRTLLASPQAARRIWALLANEDFPMAGRPVDRSTAVPDEAARAFVRRHAELITRMLAHSDRDLRGFNEEYRDRYEKLIRGQLERPHEHLEELFVRRVDFSGDEVADFVCVGRVSDDRRFGFLMIVDGRSGDVLVKHPIGETYGVVAPRCLDVDGDGCAEVLLDRWLGNPSTHRVHVFDFEAAAPIVFIDRFVEQIVDPLDGAVWFVETSPFNEFGGTAVMLAATYGAEHVVTRLAPGCVEAAKWTAYTDVTAW